MENVNQYKISKGWGLFMYIFCPLFILLGIWAMIYPFILDNEIPYDEDHIFFLIFSPLIILLFTAGLIETIYARLFIYENRVRVRSILINKELLFNDIQSFKIVGTDLILFPKDPSHKKLKISTMYEGSFEFAEKLKTMATDLNTEEINKEKSFQDEQVFHLSEDEKQGKIKGAKRMGYTLNLLAVITTFMSLSGNEIVILFILLYFLLLIFSSFYYKTAIKIIPSEISQNRWDLILIGFCFMSHLYLLACKDFPLENEEIVWISSTILSATLTAMLFQNAKNYAKSKSLKYLVIIMTFGSLILSINGSIMYSNILLSYNEKEEKYEEAIVKNIFEEYKTIEIIHFENSKSIEDINAVYDDFYNLKKGDTIAIFTIKGALGLNWRYITQH